MRHDIPIWGDRPRKLAPMQNRIAEKDRGGVLKPLIGKRHVTGNLGA